MFPKKLTQTGPKLGFDKFLNNHLLQVKIFLYINLCIGLNQPLGKLSERASGN